MKGYIGLKGKKYMVGETIYRDSILLVENPIDVFDYYEPSEGYRYYEVDAENVSPPEPPVEEEEGEWDYEEYEYLEETSKMFCRMLIVKKELSVKQIIEEAINVNPGGHPKFTPEIDGVAVSQKEYCIAFSRCNKGIAVAHRRNGVAVATNDNGVAICNRRYSYATVSGKWSTAIAIGEDSGASAEGDNSLAIACGENGKARGELGAWIIVGGQSAKVDGITIKEMVFYQLRDGKLVEVE